MVNRPKQKGTAAETSVLRYAQQNGFPFAERLTLSGAYDRGDIMLVPGPEVIIEVKAGKQAQYASKNQIDAWLDETETERVNARATIAMLVTQPRGIGNSRVRWWNAWFLRGGDLADCAADSFVFNYPCAFALEHALLMIRTAGWGTPIHGQVTQ